MPVNLAQEIKRVVGMDTVKPYQKPSVKDTTLSVRTRDGVKIEVVFSFDSEAQHEGPYSIEKAEIDLSDSQTRYTLEDLLEAERDK